MDSKSRPLLPRADPDTGQSHDHSFSQQSSTSPRQRTSACVACRVSKAKCDGGKPECSRCVRRQLTCRYRPTQAVERLMDLEAENDALRAELQNFKCTDASPNTGFFDALPTRTSSDLSATPTHTTDPTSSCETAPPQSCLVSPSTEHEVNPSTPDLFSRLNNAAQQGSLVPSISSDFIDQLDTHIIITAMTKGWDEARNQFTLDSQWDFVSDIDGDLEQSWRSVDKLASFYLIRQTMKYLTSLGISGRRTGQEIPAFMYKRPCQLTIKHPEIVDYVPWPGLREVLVCYQARYCSTAFFRILSPNFRFLFPHNFSKAVERDSKTGLFAFSAEFMQRFHDIRCFTMKKELFDAYPELRAEIPQFESSATLYLPCGSTVAWPKYLPYKQLEGSSPTVARKSRRPSTISTSSSSDKRHAMSRGVAKRERSKSPPSSPLVADELSEEESNEEL